MPAELDHAGGDAECDHREQRDQGVGRRRARLAGEDLTAFARAGQDRLQRPVVALGRDDVAGDERGHER